MRVYLIDFQSDCLITICYIHLNPKGKKNRKCDECEIRAIESSVIMVESIGPPIMYSEFEKFNRFGEIGDM